MDLDFIWRNRAEKLLVVAFWWEQQQAKCCLCHEEMEPYARDQNTNPLAASIEHLIPKRDNGPDRVGNVRLAHVLCNGALGSLWQHNNHRAENGLPPLTEEWAINRAKEQWAIKLARRAAIKAGLPIPVMPPLQFPLPEAKVKQAKITPRPAKKKRKPALANVRAAGLPRGATLPGYIPEPDAPSPSAAKAPSRAMLLAPRSGQSAARISRRQPLCASCGSPDVTMDASLSWDWNEQSWVIHEMRESFDCDICQSDTRLQWETIS